MKLLVITPGRPTLRERGGHLAAGVASLIVPMASPAIMLSAAPRMKMMKRHNDTIARTFPGVTKQRPVTSGASCDLRIKAMH